VRFAEANSDVYALAEDMLSLIQKKWMNTSFDFQLRLSRFRSLIVNFGYPKDALSLIPFSRALSLWR
jgi:hypothetical protein